MFVPILAKSGQDQSRGGGRWEGYRAANGRTEKVAGQRRKVEPWDVVVHERFKTWQATQAENGPAENKKLAVEADVPEQCRAGSAPTR
jgi:hypothetical protein